MYFQASAAEITQIQDNGAKVTHQGVICNQKNEEKIHSSVFSKSSKFSEGNLLDFV